MPCEYFRELYRVSSKVRIALRREGVRRARVFGPIPRTWVSLHADTIYAQYFNFNKACGGCGGGARFNPVWSEESTSMASKARAIFRRRRDDRISSNKIVAPTHAGIWDAGAFARLKHLPLRLKNTLARLVGQLEKGES